MCGRTAQGLRRRFEDDAHFDRLPTSSFGATSLRSSAQRRRVRTTPTRRARPGLVSARRRPRRCSNDGAILARPVNRRVVDRRRGTRLAESQRRRQREKIVMSTQNRYGNGEGGRRTSIESPDQDDESVEQVTEAHTPQAPVEEPDPDPAEHAPVDEPEHPRSPSNPPRRNAGTRKRRH